MSKNKTDKENDSDVKDSKKDRRKQKERKRLQDKTNSKSTVNIENLIKIDIKQESINLTKNLVNEKNLTITRTVEPEKKISNIGFGLKHIILDGSNIAMTHGNKTFSSIGIKFAVEFFLRRGHKNIKALVPRFRRAELKDEIILDDLESRGFLSYTPSRYLNGKLIVPYDDRFILQAAEYFDGIIVSNDNYNDIKDEKPEWKTLVDKNLLQFTFVGDLFMVPSDPMGRHGPTLDELLSANYNNRTHFSKLEEKENSNKGLLLLD
ncbi:unnamed protein product [Brachionus calyciflorus]|uniref:RNase NYN domain-containing protein n=1 Tax=Brachionus calyciflorus TaxID=104777 RepID=A0A814EDK4_9BILA|nr:unnamed protein product [Brachionus calyciflorus]